MRGYRIKEKQVQMHSMRRDQDNSSMLSSSTMGVVVGVGGKAEGDKHGQCDAIRPERF